MVQVLAVLVLWYLWLVKYGEISYVDKLVSSIPKTLKKGHCFRFKRLCSEVEKKGDFHPLSARLGPTYRPYREIGRAAACGPEPGDCGSQQLARPNLSRVVLTIGRRCRGDFGAADHFFEAWNPSISPRKFWMLCCWKLRQVYNLSFMPARLDRFGYQSLRRSAQRIINSLPLDAEKHLWRIV